MFCKVIIDSILRMEQKLLLPPITDPKMEGATKVENCALQKLNPKFYA